MNKGPIDTATRSASGSRSASRPRRRSGSRPSTQMA